MTTRVTTVLGLWLGLAACTLSPSDPVTFSAGQAGDGGDAGTGGPVDDITTGASAGMATGAPEDPDTGPDAGSDDDPAGGDPPGPGGDSSGPPPSPPPPPPDTCGDGVVDPGEDCDGDVATTCEAEGFDGGEIACGASCTLDVSGCFACGDGVVGGDEACDCGGGACTPGQLDNLGCTDFDAASGQPFSGGALGCTAECTHDTSACAVCGDGAATAGEDCDGADLGGADCFDEGYLGGGTLVCSPSCTFDTSSCAGPICGVADPGVGACPAECDSCTAGVCEFDCPGNIIDGGPCNDQTIVCPPGWPCHVDCGEEGCADTTIVCGDGVCTVDCDGIGACAGADVQCTSVQSCGATCDIFSSPNLDCGPSCDCQAC